jgi:metal-dependent HD superfamily phosphatase/phosphodiesterase
VTDPLDPGRAADAIAFDLPAEGNRALASLVDAANGDRQLKAWLLVQQANADRLGLSDHSWVHVQKVMRMALKLLRLLVRAGVQPAVVTDYGMTAADAEVVVVAASLLHDTGMSVDRGEHHTHGLTLAAAKLEALLAGAYDEPRRSILAAEALHAIATHRRAGRPVTVEAGIVRVADGLDIVDGRPRLSPARTRLRLDPLWDGSAIEDVAIGAGRERPVRVVVRMNDPVGVFKLDELLAAKLIGSGIEQHIEVRARIEGPGRARQLTVFGP